MTFARGAGWRDGWYVIPHEVTWRDLDGRGHVNNAVFFTYFEWARTRFWLELMGERDPGPDSIGFIVAHASCDFHRQLSLLDAIETRVRIGEIRNSSFEFLNEIVTSSSEIAATGRVVAVRFDWTRNEKMAVDENMRERIRRFQNQEVA